MAISKNFIGLNQFVHFYGVVEDRQDPQQTGRVRVRCLGFHTKNKLLLPTADLPWAQVLLPITSSGISGIGQTPLGLVEGSWVVGYFRDGPDAQEPIVLGSLPGKPKVGASPNADDGFFDPAGIYPRHIGEPDVNRLARNAKQSTDEDGDTWVEKVIVSAIGDGSLIKVYQRAKDGTIVPELIDTGVDAVINSAGDIIDAKSVTEVLDKVTGIKNKLTGAISGKIQNAVESVKSIASGKKINFQSLALTAIESNPAASLLLQRATQIKDIATAIPGMWTNAKGAIIGGDIAGLITAAKSIGSTIKSVTNISATFSEPESRYAAQYPFNHVRETESGHIVEFDDTPGAERIHERHKSMTGYEINPEGDRIVKVVDDQHHYVADHDKLNVGMNKDDTIGGSYKINVGTGMTITVSKGEIMIEAKTGKVNIVATDDINLTTLNNLNLKCRKYQLLVTGGPMNEYVTGQRKSLTSGRWIQTGSPIDLNPIGSFQGN